MDLEFAMPAAGDWRLGAGRSRWLHPVVGECSRAIVYKPSSRYQDLGVVDLILK